MNMAILIPAYQPDQKLTDLVHQLAKCPFLRIVVVNDGSGEECLGIFHDIEKTPHCLVIHHAENQGKGAALKTGMKAILDMDGEPLGCITADADGQHLPEDIVHVANIFERNSQTLILGSRDFSLQVVPQKSKIGNIITRNVFWLFTGKNVTDTQTGLRAIPLAVMERFLELPGDRYDFEMNMLTQVAKSDIPIMEVPINTVYIDQNKASHFNTVLDSWRIYKEIIGFSLSSLFCSLIDMGMFWLITTNQIAYSLLGATCIARAVSSSVNFILNKKIVFQNKHTGSIAAVKYLMLCIFQMLFSWLILEGFTLLGFSPLIVLKMIADGLLFLISFTVQRMFIFRNKRKRI